MSSRIVNVNLCISRIPSNFQLYMCGSYMFVIYLQPFEMEQQNLAIFCYETKILRHLNDPKKFFKYLKIVYINRVFENTSYLECGKALKATIDNNKRNLDGWQTCIFTGALTWVQYTRWVPTHYTYATILFSQATKYLTEKCISDNHIIVKLIIENLITDTKIRALPKIEFREGRLKIGGSRKLAAFS